MRGEEHERPEVDFPSNLEILQVSMMVTEENFEEKEHWFLFLEFSSMRCFFFFCQGAKLSNKFQRNRDLKKNSKIRSGLSKKCQRNRDLKKNSRSGVGERFRSFPKTPKNHLRK